MSKWYKKGERVYKLYKSGYERDKDGERVFTLTNGDKKYTFESWQMAKKIGWIKK